MDLVPVLHHFGDVFRQTCLAEHHIAIRSRRVLKRLVSGAFRKHLQALIQRKRLPHPVPSFDWFLVHAAESSRPSLSVTNLSESEKNFRSAVSCGDALASISPEQAQSRMTGVSLLFHEGAMTERRTIMVVEDEYFLADDCAGILKCAGFDVVGPFKSIEDARSGMTYPLDGALLDINLEGTTVYPLLDDLLERKVPVTLYTGYSRSLLPAKYAHLPLVTKPQNCADAVESLRDQLG